MACTRAKYTDRKSAIDAKRSMLRQFRTHESRALTLSVAYCDDCDTFHVSADKNQYPFTERSVTILQCIAQGYRDTETCKIVNMTPRSVEWEVGNMLKRFNALSRANLIAIAIAIGLINPNDFVPSSEDDERLHA